MRNVYTVLSYDRFKSKELANLTIPEEDAAFALLSITNITQALDEFNTVRIQHQPLPSSSSLPTPGTSTDGGGGSGKHGLGKLWVLISIIIAFGVVVGAFTARWWLRRRRAIRRIAAATYDTADSKSPASIALANLSKQRGKPGEPLDAEDEETLHSRPWSEWGKPSSASFMTSSTNTRVGEWVEPGDLAEMMTHGSTPHNEEGQYESARSRTIRAPSRVHSMHGSLSDPAMLVADASLLTNIPTLDEITPEALSSSRYPTFSRLHHHPLPPQPPLATVPIYEAPTPPESESTHQQPSPPLSPAGPSLGHALSIPVDNHVGEANLLTPASPSRPFIQNSVA